MITISEEGTVDGLNHLFKISSDLFDQLSQEPQAFASILKK
jgi:hypothetical protein